MSNEEIEVAEPKQEGFWKRFGKAAANVGLKVLEIWAVKKVSK